MERAWVEMGNRAELGARNGAHGRRPSGHGRRCELKTRDCSTALATARRPAYPIAPGSSTVEDRRGVFERAEKPGYTPPGPALDYHGLLALVTPTPTPRRR